MTTEETSQQARPDIWKEAATIMAASSRWGDASKDAIDELAKQAEKAGALVIARARQDGRETIAGFAIVGRLDAAQTAQLKASPDHSVTRQMLEHTAGGDQWILELLSPAAVVQPLIDLVRKTKFPSGPVHVRLLDSNGNAHIRTL